MGFSVQMGVIYISSLLLPLLQIITESQMGVLTASKCSLAVIGRDWCWRVGCVCVLLHFLFKPYHIPRGVGEEKCFLVSVF